MKTNDPLPAIIASWIVLLAASVLGILLFGGCATKKPPVASPVYSAVTRQAGDVNTTLGSAANSGKIVFDKHAQAGELLDFLDKQTELLLGGSK